MSPAQVIMTYLFASLCIATGVVACVACVRDMRRDARLVLEGEFVSLLQFLGLLRVLQPFISSFSLACPLSFSNKETSERDSGQKFSAQPHMKAYVPQIHNRSFPHPLIACDISQIDDNHIGWVDPLRSHSFYCLSGDVKALIEEEPAHPKLSIVRYWPSSDNEKAARAGGDSGIDSGSAVQPNYGSMLSGKE